MTKDVNYKILFTQFSLYSQLYLLILLSFSLTSQTLVKGRLLNGNKEPIPFATVALLKAIDSTIVKGTYTNENGNFEFEKISNGSYLVKSIVVGMATNLSKLYQINAEQTEFLIEDIVLQKSGVDLQTVDIIAIKPLVEFKNGNIILNVENSALAAGNSAYDLLKRAPGVSIDNSNNIAIQGKQGVKVMIDGRMQQLSTEQLANMLQSISAEGVSTIEVIKNPSVKYDAEGTAGIIQIKTKKVKLVGFNGTMNAGVSKGELLSGNLGMALNYKAEKFAITSSLQPIKRNRLVTNKLYRSFKTTGNDLAFDQTSNETKQTQSLDYKLALDYYLNNKTTLGITVDGGLGQPNQTSTNTTNIKGNNTIGFDYLEAPSTIINQFNNNNLNINALHKLDTIGTEIDASFDYTTYKENGNNSYGNYYFNSNKTQVLGLYPNIYKNTLNSNITMLIGALNFKKPLAKQLVMEAGLKFSGISTNNNFLFERKDTLSNTYYNDIKFSNEFLYIENISAGYINFQKQFTKLSLQLGLRAEHTQATGVNKTINTNIVRNYLQVFPSVSIDYTQSQKHIFQLSYNRRINRPDYFQLNPFKFYLDQYTANEGNPFLNPQTSNNIMVTHVFMNALYNTLSYSRTENVIMEVIIQNDITRETTQTNKNIGSSDLFVYNMFAYIPVKKWMVTQIDLSAWYQSFSGNINGINFNLGKPSGQINISNEVIYLKILVLSYQVNIPPHYNMEYFN